MIEEPSTPSDSGPTACPFVAFEDDRDHRSSAPDYNHRCFAAPEPEPRAFPHQERYCLSAEFARCPVFLDWARQEAAAIKPSPVPAVAAAFGDAPVGGAGSGVAEDDAAAPAFLAARSRVSVTPEIAPASKRTADASAGLWSYEGESRRSTAPSAPIPPSSVAEPAVAMARRGPSHPGWENPPRLENFPRLRSREEHRANQPLFVAAVAVALIMVALVLFPIITSPHGGGPAPSGSLPAGGSAPLDSSVPSAQDTSSAPMSFLVYRVKSGDYMAAIAARFNIPLWELELANPGVDPNYIQVGQPLNIPAPGQLTMPPASPAPSAT
ncbi:MAG: LysM peptidoglycan-binding domain-containing protein [Candidatus Limnocylindrales bacterium]